jgi:hypothetical protein
MTRLLAVAAALFAFQGLAQDAFEIEVYDSETTAPGSAGLELHLNSALESPHQALRMTLEPHLGLTSWAEVGMYFQTAVGGGGFDFTGAKARLKLRWPEKLFGHLGLALNQELASVRADYEAARLGWEMRPVIDAHFGRFYLSVNPIVGAPLAGPEAGQLAFEPAAKASYEVTARLALGLEYYGATGPLAHPAPLAQQTHRVFAVANLDWAAGGHTWTLDAGLGYGLVGVERFLVKVIVGVDFE